MRLLKILVLVMLISDVSAQHGFFMQKDCSSHFGANLQGLSPTEESNAVKNTLKMKWIRISVDLGAYSGGVFGALQTAFNLGLHCSPNVNWGGAGGGKRFPTPAQLPQYSIKLHQFLLGNAQFLVGGLVVIENEPLNTHFYDWSDSGTSVKDYLAELKIAVDSFRAHNIEITDGCTHLGYYGQLCNGNLGNITTKRADSIWQAAKTMKLNYVNYHFEAKSISGSSFTHLTNDIIKNDAACAHEHTGHLFITNEWHQEDNATTAQEDSLAANIVTETRKAHVRIAINFGGSGSSGAMPLVDANAVITPLGAAYRDAVISLH